MTSPETTPVVSTKKEAVLAKLNAGVITNMEIMTQLAAEGVSVSYSYVDGLRNEFLKASGKEPTARKGAAPKAPKGPSTALVVGESIRAAILRVYNSGVIEPQKIYAQLTTEGKMDADADKKKSHMTYIYTTLGEHKKKGASAPKPRGRQPKAKPVVVSNTNAGDKEFESAPVVVTKAPSVLSTWVMEHRAALDLLISEHGFSGVIGAVEERRSNSKRVKIQVAG